MATPETIRLDDKLNPETKVYRIGRMLKEQNKIDVNLWYAILELKDKHLKDIVLNETEEHHYGND